MGTRYVSILTLSTGEGGIKFFVLLIYWLGNAILRLLAEIISYIRMVIPHTFTTTHHYSKNFYRIFLGRLYHSDCVTVVNGDGQMRILSVWLGQSVRLARTSLGLYQSHENYSPYRKIQAPGVQLYGFCIYTINEHHKSKKIFYWKWYKEWKKNCEQIRGSLNKFPDFFRMGTFIDSTHMKL